MFYMLKTKKIMCFSLLLGLLYCSNFPIWAKDITENKTIVEIKKELKELKQIQKKISLKFPHIKKNELKERVFAQFGDYFRNNKKYNNYIRTLTKSQRKDFSVYRQLLVKKDFYKCLLVNDIAKTMEELKKHSSNKRLVDFYIKLKEKPSDFEINKYKMLQEKLKVPEDFIDYLIRSAKFQGLYHFYLGVIMTINKPVEQKKKKIKRLMAKLYKANKSEENIKNKNEVDNFYKDSWIALQSGSRQTGAYLIFRYYYNIKLFSDFMQSPEKKKIIKKVLQESKLMRKAVVFLIIGSRCSRNVKRYVKKYNQQLDYDNFKKYWSVLREISKKLPKEIFPDMNKQKIEKYPIAVRQAAKLDGQCFLECFFIPICNLKTSNNPIKTRKTFNSIRCLVHES